MPRDLFEGQLFGYRRGAFTGAASDQPGVLREILPLVERKPVKPDDVIALARHFVRLLTPAGQQPPVLGPDALTALNAHRWPGNVRELRNVIERSLAFEPLPPVLGAQHRRIAI